MLHSDPLLNRQLNVLIRVLSKITSRRILFVKSRKKSGAAQTYANFALHRRKDLFWKRNSRYFKNVNVFLVAKCLEASKEIGNVTLTNFCSCRNENQAARRSPVSRFFAMQLDLQEVDQLWLQSMLSSFCSAITSHMQYSRTDSKCWEMSIFAITFHPWVWAIPL
jgi:hypothetical protein